MLRRALSLLLAACALCALLVPASLAATIQSNQAVYHLSQTRTGRRPSLTPHPVPHPHFAAARHRVRSDLGHQLIVERFTYRPVSGYWVLEDTLSSQEHLIVRDHAYIYHVITQDSHSIQAMDAGGVGSVRREAAAERRHHHRRTGGRVGSGSGQ